MKNKEQNVQKVDKGVSASEVGLTQEDIKDLGAVYTPPELIDKMLDELDFDWENIDHSKTFLDPTGGSGNFLVQIAKRGVKAKNLYSVDIDERNVEIMRKRVFDECVKNGEDPDEVKFHLNRNIVQGDALKYHYEFWQHDDLDEW